MLNTGPENATGWLEGLLNHILFTLPFSSWPSGKRKKAQHVAQRWHEDMCARGHPKTPNRPSPNMPERMLRVHRWRSVFRAAASESRRTLEVSYSHRVDGPGLCFLYSAATASVLLLAQHCKSQRIRLDILEDHHWFFFLSSHSHVCSGSTANEALA